MISDHGFAHLAHSVSVAAIINERIVEFPSSADDLVPAKGLSAAPPRPQKIYDLLCPRRTLLPSGRSTAGLRIT